MEMSDLPKGWKELSLDEIFDSYESGSRPKGGVRGITEGVPSIGGEHLAYTGKFDFSNIKYVPTEFANRMTKGRIQINDLLIVKDGATTGKIAIVDEKFPFDFAVANEHVFVCRINENYLSKYVFHYLYSSEGQKRILENFQGSAQGGINKSFARGTQIPIPLSFDMQKLIVERLDIILGKMNQASQRLEKIPAILKRFRQSVLSSACSGRLAADWREENQCGDWEKKKLIDIVEKRGIFDGPFGSELKTSDYVNNGIQVVRLENVGVLNFIKEKKSYISEEKYQTLLKHTVFEGDIIFSSFISENIRVCQIPKLDTPAVAKADCFCIRPKNKIMLNKYLCYALSDPNIYNFFTELVHGATRPRINTTQLKNICISVPPLPEQEEIVRRVDKLFAVADKIEQRYKNAKAQLARAEKAIYAKAFRGELVSQEAHE